MLETNKIGVESKTDQSPKRVLVLHTYDSVKAYVENEKYELISKEYKGIHEKLKVKCSKGHGFIITLSNFKRRKYKCVECKNQERNEKNKKKPIKKELKLIVEKPTEIETFIVKPTKEKYYIDDELMYVHKPMKFAKFDSKKQEFEIKKFAKKSMEKAKGFDEIMQSLSFFPKNYMVEGTELV